MHFGPVIVWRSLRLLPAGGSTRCVHARTRSSEWTRGALSPSLLTGSFLVRSYVPAMYSTSNFQPKVAPGLRNSLRVSTRFLTYPTRHLLRHHPEEGSADGLSADERLSFSEDDLVDIDPEELSAANALPIPPPNPGPRSPLSPFDCKDAYISSRNIHLTPIYSPHIPVNFATTYFCVSCQEPCTTFCAGSA